MIETAVLNSNEVCRYLIAAFSVIKLGSFYCLMRGIDALWRPIKPGDVLVEGHAFTCLPSHSLCWASHCCASSTFEFGVHRTWRERDLRNHCRETPARGGNQVFGQRLHATAWWSATSTSTSSTTFCAGSLSNFLAQSCSSQYVACLLVLCACIIFYLWVFPPNKIWNVF